MIGLDYKIASVEEREKLLFDLRNSQGILLATCNRVELYQKVTREAVRHLFRVAAGLESQILGETEILGQVKLAYEKGKGLDPQLDRMFEKAIEVGRKVRIETGISRGNVSVASVAVQKAIAQLNYGQKIVLIGVGKVNRSILKTLLKKGFDLVFIANRTFDKARELADKCGGRAVKFEKLQEELVDADLIISSTSAPHMVLKKENILPRQKPLLIFDLAAPRDVDPAVAEIAGVKLLNIDDIQESISHNLLVRKAEAVKAERIVDEEVSRFCEQYALEPAGAG